MQGTRAARPLINSGKKKNLDRERSRSGARFVLVYLRKGSSGQVKNGEANKMKRVRVHTHPRTHVRTHTMRAARRTGVVETRCPAFENEFKHTEARVTEVSGSVNFGDKFHEVHFGWRTWMHVCALETRIVLQCESETNSSGNHRFGSLHSIRCRDRLR